MNEKDIARPIRVHVGLDAYDLPPVSPTRRQKRTWRRRVSRARHTKHLYRRPIYLAHETRIGVWDRPDPSDPENDWPARQIVAPWLPF